MNNLDKFLRKIPAYRSQRGQGLLELVVAVGIISLCIVGVFALVLATTLLSGSSKQQILAANLAREGVEVVRGMRDTNWLKIDSSVDCDAVTPGNQLCTWNQDLSGTGNDYSAIPIFHYLANAWTLDFPNVLETDFGTTKTQMYLTLSGVYFQQASGFIPVGTVAVPYWRIVTTNPICWNLTAGSPESTEFVVASDGLTCSSPPGGLSFTQVGIEIRSRVRWLDKNHTRNLEVVEKMYNWKG